MSKSTGLRVAAAVATLAILFPAAGCIRFHEDLVVYADGSGKMTLTGGSRGSTSPDRPVSLERKK